jgi:RNA polymerase sigma-70 factor, ECF subfamily
LFKEERSPKALIGAVAFWGYVRKQFQNAGFGTWRAFYGRVEGVNNARSVAFSAYHEELQELISVFDRRLASFKRIALRVLGNAADAEDAVQDAFLSAYKHLDQFKGQAQMSTWLTTIVVNKARMKVRQRSRQLHFVVDAEDRDENKHPFSDALSERRPTPEEVCQRLEVWERLAQLLTSLSPPLRTTFQLREMDGLSIREAAQVLGVAEGTIKARLARARIKLKQLMQKSLRRKCRATSATGL